MISLASAMYAGDCMEVNLSELESLDNVVYSVVGNSSDLIGMNITLNETIKKASVCFVPNYAPDNFTLIFFGIPTNEIIKEIPVGRGGGGSSRTKYIDRNVTVYEPKYIDKIINNTDVVEVEKIVEEIVYQDTGYNLWMIFLATATGAVMIWILMRRKGDGTETD